GQRILRLAAGDLLGPVDLLAAADRVIDVEQAGAAEQPLVGDAVMALAKPGEDVELLVRDRREIDMAALARNHRSAAMAVEDRADAETGAGPHNRERPLPVRRCVRSAERRRPLPAEIGDRPAVRREIVDREERVEAERAPRLLEREMPCRV